LARQPQGHEPSGDGGTARAAVGLQHIAVDVDCALTQRRKVDHTAQRATDQALDLDRAAVRPALAHVTLLTLPGRRGKHAVLGCHPAAARSGQPTGNTLLRRGRADDARLAHRYQGRARGGADEAGIDGGRAQRIRPSPVAALGRRRAHAATLSPNSTWTTSPNGICRKRVPRAWNDSTSAV